MSPTPRPRHRLSLPITSVLIIAVIGAALLPNLGLVAAQSNCPYGSCTTAGPAPNYLPYYAVLAVLVIVAIALGILLMSRRRRGGRGPGPLTEAEPAAGGPSGPTGPSGEMVETAEMAAVGGSSAAAAAPAVPPGAAAAYTEGPEDVGAALPSVSVPAGAGAAAPEGGEADIDSLMQELDKISGEILKRPAAKKDEPPAEGNDEGVEPS